MRRKMISVAACLLLMCNVADGDVARTDEEQMIYEMFMDYVRCSELHDIKCVGDYIADDFVQHNPRLQPSGKESIIMHLRNLWARQRENPPNIRTESVMVDGDRVVWLRSIRLSKPEDSAATYEAFMIDIFRVEDGKFAEHWDTGRL